MAALALLENAPTSDASGATPEDGAPKTAAERIAWAEEEQIRFGLALVDRGECTLEQLTAALWASGSTKDSIVDSLTQQGVIRHERLIELMQELNSDQIATTIRFDVPVSDKSFLEQEKVVIFGLSNRSLYLGCLGDQALVESHFSRQFREHGIRFMPVRPEVVERFLSNLDLLPHNTEERYNVGKIEMVRYVPEAITDSDVLDTIINYAGVIGASDVHIEPKAKSYTILVRKDRIRRIVHEGSLRQYAVVRAQVKNRAGVDAIETRKPGDGKFSKTIMGRSFDLRVATVPTIHPNQEKIVIRLLDPDRSSMPLAVLGISKIDVLQDIVRHPSGVLLISGKTNSGKTTSLTAILREEDRINRSCIEIGDPIENRLEFVTQTQVNEAEGVNFGFHEAIRAAQRLDAEVLVVGEVRDRKTADAMAMAAETGMFVMATTHAGSVGETPFRLKRLGVDRDSMRTLLRGVLSQRLLRKVCKTCLGIERRGCSTCRGVGYQGMTVVSEIAMTPSPDDVDALYERQLPYEPFAVDALRKLDLGVVDEFEIHRAFQSEIKFVDKHAKDFPGVEELRDRVLSVINNPKLRRAAEPSSVRDTFASGLDVSQRRYMAELESKLHTVAAQPEVQSEVGWGQNFIGAM